MGDLTPHFSKHEFQCPCCGLFIHSAPLLYVLEAVREHFDKPVTVNSGTRCKARNKAVGGAAGSRHLRGDAADITVKDTEPFEIANYCELLVRDRGGVGRYTTFTHVDARGFKARWSG